MGSGHVWHKSQKEATGIEVLSVAWEMDRREQWERETTKTTFVNNAIRKPDSL